MPPDPQERALIRAVCAAPDDDLPRLVYADWLDEHGQPARARFIRVQCSLARLREEEAELLDRHGREWADPLVSLGADGWKFHRGFPEEFRVTPLHFLRQSDRFADVTPCTHIHLNAFTDADLVTLARLPVVRQFRSLSVNAGVEDADTFGDFLGGEGVRALAASPHLTGLRRLSLCSDRLDLAAAEVIRTSPAFAGLTHLALRGATVPHLPLPQNYPSRLAHTPNLSRLESVTIDDDPVGRHVLNMFRQQDPGRGGGPATPGSP